MAITKPTRNMLSTGVSDSSDSTFLTADSSENATFAGNLVVSGNLTVSGTTTTVSSTVETHADPLIELNTGAGSNANDLGFVFERGSTGDNACLIWDESADSFLVGTTTATGTSTGNMTVTAGDFTAGKITVDNVTINGTTIGHTSDTDLMTLADGGLTVAGTIASTGVVTANAGVVIDNFTIDGTEIDLSSGSLTVDVAGDIYLDADGGDIVFKDGGTDFGEFSSASNNLTMKSSIQDADIKFNGNDGGSAITALTLDMSEAGAATFNNKIIATELDISGNVDIDGVLETDNLTVGGAQGSDGQVLTSTGSGVGWEDASSFNADQAQTFNESGNDVDFRVESNSNANRFFIDGGSNSGEGAVIIGHNASLGQHRVFQIAGNSPDKSGMEMFKYTNDTSGPTISMSKSRGGAIGTAAAINDNDIIGTINWFADDGTDTGNYVATIHAEIDGTPGSNDTPGALVFGTTADSANTQTERMRITSTGKVGIGTASPAALLDVGGGSIADPTILIDSASGGDPTLIFDTGAANRTGIILYKDEGTTSGFIKYEHNGNKLNFGSGSSSTVTMCVNDGAVGIGTTSPTAGSMLELYHSGSNSNYGAHMRIVNGGSHPAGIRLNSGHGNWTIYNSKTIGDCLEFADDSESKVWWTLRAGGRTEFQSQHHGDAPPGDWLFSNDDSDDGTTANVSLLVQNGNTSFQILPWVSYGARLGTRAAGWDTSGNQNLYITTADTARITITHSDGVAAGDFNDTCDERLKKNIISLGETTSKLKELRPVSFNWIENNKAAEGFIAQEIEAIFPELIKTQDEVNTNDLVGTGDEGKIADVKSVNTNGLLARAIKTIQEQQTVIETLESRIHTIEQRLV